MARLWLPRVLASDGFFRYGVDLLTPSPSFLSVEEVDVVVEREDSSFEYTMCTPCTSANDTVEGYTSAVLLYSSVLLVASVCLVFLKLLIDTQRG